MAQPINADALSEAFFKKTALQRNLKSSIDFIKSSKDVQAIIKTAEEITRLGNALIENEIVIQECVQSLQEQTN